MRLENLIALQYIKSSRINKEISTSSRIVVIAIASAIIFFLAAVSIMNGYIFGILRLSLDVNSFHVSYTGSYSYSETISDLEYLKKDKDIKYIDLYRESNALLTKGNKNTAVNYFRSMPEDIFSKDKGFDKAISLISGNKSLNLNEIMISEKTASKLNVKVGDKIFTTAISQDEKPQFMIKRYKVSGIFTTGLMEFDEHFAMIGSETGEELFKDNVKYKILIKLHDHEYATKFVDKYTSKGFFSMTTWLDANYNEITALKFQKNIIAFIVIIVIFVAVLNILSTIYITIHEKKKDIGILKSIGFPPLSIVNIFLLKGIYLATIGMTVGIILGMLTTLWLNEILTFFAGIANYFNTIIYKISSIFIDYPAPDKITFFSKDFYLDKIYTDISFYEILFVLLLTFAFSIFTSIIPAIKGGNVNPSEVLSDE